MPRYKFSWSNFPEELLTRIATDVGLDTGEPAAELRRAYGARPKAEFVQDAWPILLATWLETDTVSREWIVDELRLGGFGRQDVPVSTKQRQLDYLATCRNARSLREIVLAAFLVAGEPEQVPEIRNVAPRGDVAQTRPTEPTQPVLSGGSPAVDDHIDIDADVSDDDLDTWVERVLSDFLGVTVSRDRDGDIPIPRGSSVLYIRPHDNESSFLEVFSLVLSDFEMSPAVYEAVNTINAKVPFAKTTVNNDGTAIIMSALLFADEITARALCSTVDIVSSAADHFDNLLQKRFGGQLALDDDDDGIEI